MKHEFCDYEISLELKGLGFNYKCLAYTFIGNCSASADSFFIDHDCLFWNNKEFYVGHPLWQQVIDFFMDKFGIWIEVSTTLIRFYDSDEKLMPPKYQFLLEDVNNRDDEYIYHSADDGLFYDNHKEARRAAILKAIEVCKKK